MKRIINKILLLSTLAILFVVAQKQLKKLKQ